MKFLKIFLFMFLWCYNPTGIYLPKVINRNKRTRCEISPKLTIKTPERRHCRLSGVFIVNYEHNLYLPCSSVPIVNFEQVIAGWEVISQKSWFCISPKPYILFFCFSVLSWNLILCSWRTWLCTSLTALI